MEELLFSLNATVPVFLVMVVGYLLKILHIVDEPFIKTLNSFNFKVTLPFLVFKDIAEADFYNVWDTRYVLFCSFATLGSIVVICVLVLLFYRDRDRRGELMQASYRSSAAVLGLAFIQNMFGNSGMAPLMIIGSVPLYNIAAVLILSFTGPQAKGMDRASLGRSIKGVLTNPIIVGILLGIVFSVCRISLPTILSKTVSNIAVLASPLALIGLGAGFEGRKALNQLKPTAVASTVKLVVLPALILPMAVGLGFTGEKLIAIAIMLGSPTTPSCYIMAKNMGHEGIVTSGAVVATTFFSSVTLTGIIFILRYLGFI